MDKEKTILDVCCGGRMFWFDKKNPDVLFLDNRNVDEMLVGNGRNARKFSCKPNTIMDFRKLDLPSRKFSLVVFDPPHLVRAGKKSYMSIKYGKLNRETWRDDLRKGLSECFRVLRKNGVLIFKWSECQILLSEILKLTPHSPLFGHKSGKQQKTHWICFMKI